VAHQRSGSEFLQELTNYAAEIVKYDASPRFIFDQLLDYCENKQRIRPSYSALQEIIAKIVLDEEQRLSSQISLLIDIKTKQTIDGLLKEDDLFYKLTSLKKIQKILLLKK
jgi:hypothetical protein